MPRLVMFGAGNIGRSFVGQLFSAAGYAVQFVDIADPIVRALNERGEYDVIIKHPDNRDETLRVGNVSAIRGDDPDAVARAVAEADIAATAVGQRGLPPVLRNFAKGLELREKESPGRPLDLIIAENLHGAAAYVKKELTALLPEGFPLSERLGLVETSIGKMVPIMRQEDVEKDPLWVFAEPYNRLIVAKKGFINPLPEVEGLKPVDNIQAYVDRKLYIHNLGHSATAYLGYAKNHDFEFIWQVLEDRAVYDQVAQAMKESARALVAEYPDAFTRAMLDDHIADLLQRFQNRALGDTVFRVGRDLYRKLARQDRLIGPLLLAEKYGFSAVAVARAAAAAIGFRKGDEVGQLFPDDAKFAELEASKGLRHVLQQVSGLSAQIPAEKAIIENVFRQSPGLV